MVIHHNCNNLFYQKTALRILFYIKRVREGCILLNTIKTPKVTRDLWRLYHKYNEIIPTRRKRALTGITDSFFERGTHYIL